MGLVVSNAGELLLLEVAVKAGEDYTLKLFTNNYTPNATSTVGSFTQATFSGYSAKTLSAASWGSATTNQAGKAEITYEAQSWNVGSSQTVYGYYVSGATSGTLLWAERFGVPRAVQSGDVLQVVPKLTLASET